MSTLPNTPNTPNNSEEVDLGQLFKLIGAAFDRFFNFIYSIFKTVFSVFIWLVFFIKKRIIILVLALVLGYVMGLTFQKFSLPKYVSFATIVQNYPTGEYLYNSIDYYNGLLNDGDYKTLGSILNINKETAESIIKMEINPAVGETDKLLAYSEFVKTIDSVSRKQMSYPEFLDKKEVHTYKYQQINIESIQNLNFEPIFKNIVELVNSNDFFKKEQNKDHVELTQTIDDLGLALAESDSLQNTYKGVLQQKQNSDKTSEIGITFEGSGETNKTREYDLFQNDLILRSQIVDAERGLLERKYILEMIPSRQETGLQMTTKKLFEQEYNFKIYYAIILFSLSFIILLGAEFLKFLETYKPSV